MKVGRMREGKGKGRNRKRGNEGANALNLQGPIQLEGKENANGRQFSCIRAFPRVNGGSIVPSGTDTSGYEGAGVCA